MTNQPPPEELFAAQRPVRSDFARARTYRVRRVLTCAVLAALVAGGAYGIYAWNRAPAEIPTIKAEGSLKQKPEQPGGIDIPNQDVLAYQQIDNSNNKPAVEHLLPPPEVPQPPAAVPAPAPAAPPTAKVENLMPPAPVPVVTTVTRQKPVTQAGLAPAPAAAPLASVEHVAVNNPGPANNNAAPPSSPPEAAPAAAVAVAPAAAPVQPVPAPAADKTASKPTASGKKNVRIQLASFEDLDTARHQMAHMETKYATALGPARLHLAKADLGARGIYYRVQSNPISDGEAHDVCAALKKLKAGCIVVKP